MGGIFCTCYHQLLLRERPSSLNNIDKAVGVFASFAVDIKKLESSIADDNLVSLHWCTDVMNLVRKIHLHLLIFVQSYKATKSWEGVNCTEEYMKESLILLDFCNSLKSAISEMNRYCLVIDVVAKKLHDEASLSTASSKNEMERLQKENDKVYNTFEKWKGLNLFNLENPKTNTKSKDFDVHVVYALKGTMNVLCLLLFSSMFYSVPIEVDFDGIYSNIPRLNLKLFSVSVRKLVHRLCDKNCSTRPVLIENVMVDRRVFYIKDEAAIDEELKNKSVALKEGLEKFECVVNELFAEVIKGRNKVLTMVTAA